MQGNEHGEYRPVFVIPVGDGIIIPVAAPEVENHKALKLLGTPEYSIEEYGMKITIDNIRIPLPVNVIEHLIASGQTVYVYLIEGQGYIGEFIGQADLDRDRILRILGSWEARYGNGYPQYVIDM